MKTKIPVVVLFCLAVVFFISAVGQAQNPPLQVKPQVEKMALPAGPMMITQVRMTRLGDEGMAVIDVVGRNFGPLKDHRLTMDGVPMQRIVGWSADRITFELREPIERVRHEFEFAILNAAGQVASNRFRHAFLVTWDRGNPMFGAQESEVTLLCWGAGIQQGGMKVWLGNTPMDVLNWQHDGRGQNQIRVRVPKVAPGNYRLMVNDGGEKISEPGEFQVR